MQKCPTCNTKQQLNYYQSVNITLQPELKQKVLDHQLNLQRCSHCNNQINAFTVENLYPTPHTFTMNKQNIFSRNVNPNNNFHLPKKFELQVTPIYFALDKISQGKIHLNKLIH
ncbi:MAG: hypothetical protein H6553_06465 [Chitinophagales bacterium]|nr:hypothetical protein [Chitinophagales bacterium]